jgi:hypothetical protein
MDKTLNVAFSNLKMLSQKSSQSLFSIAQPGLTTALARVSLMTEAK